METITNKSATPQRKAASEGNFYPERPHDTGPGMNDRIRRLRELTVETRPSLSIERALHETAFYQQNYGKHSMPVLRALNFLDHAPAVHQSKWQAHANHEGRPVTSISS